MDGDCSSSILRRRIKALAAEVQDELSEVLDDVIVVAVRGKEEKILPLTTQTCIGLRYLDKGYKIYSRVRFKSR